MTVLEPPAWSKQRWLIYVAALFVVQAGLILWADHRRIPLQERPIFRTVLHLAVDESTSREIARTVSPEDPTVLALPSLRGFSGPAWLEFSPPDYQPVERTEGPRWLPLQESAFGSTFASLLTTSSIAPPLVADKPIPRLRSSYEQSPPVFAITTESRLRLGGAVVGRALVSPVELPSWRHSDVLSNTVVQVAVDSDGVTLFPAVMSQSGSKEVDAFALNVAARLRFQPLLRSRAPGVPSNPELTWGTFTFQWHTVPLPITNPAAMLP